MDKRSIGRDLYHDTEQAQLKMAGLLISWICHLRWEQRVFNVFLATTLVRFLTAPSKNPPCSTSTVNGKLPSTYMSCNARNQAFADNSSQLTDCTLFEALHRRLIPHPMCHCPVAVHEATSLLQAD